MEMRGAMAAHLRAAAFVPVRSAARAGGSATGSPTAGCRTESRATRYSDLSHRFKSEIQRTKTSKISRGETEKAVVRCSSGSGMSAPGVPAARPRVGAFWAFCPRPF